MLASTASRCNLISHATAQMPYALLGAFLSVACGTLPLAFGFSPVQGLVGIIAIFLSFRIVGQEASLSKNPRLAAIIEKEMQI